MEKQYFYLQNEISNRLTEEARRAFLASMDVKKFKAGERMITRGEKGDKMYILQEGVSNVNVDTENDTYQETHQIVSLKPGDLFGEMALVTGEPRIANVDAETDVVALEIGAEKFDALCDEHFSFREILTKIVQEKIYSSIFREEGETGKYNIKDILGKGDISAVYKGVHRHLNRFVAIKVLHHNIAMNHDFFNKFKDEAMKIVRLIHNNIVKVYDITYLYRTIFIFMEYLEGDSLKNSLNRMPQQPLNRVIDILLQICSGLAHAHGQGILHQNLKPTNIFILPNDQVKLIDFGLAYPSGSTDASLGVGLAYMSPEQIAGKRLDERSDIYTLGITAFEMITGQRPFIVDDVDKFLEIQATQDIPDPRSLRPDLPEELCRFVIQATQKNPEKRYQKISEIINDLHPLTGRKDIIDYKKLNV